MSAANDSVTPLAGLSGEQTHAVLAAATTAPSLYGTRPWRLVTSADGISLYLERDRLLPIVDPDTQQALLACGAALLNLRLAIRVLDRNIDVRLLPDRHQPDLLAVVRMQGHRPAIPAEHDLTAALVEVSGPPRSTTAPIALRSKLHRAAATEQAWLVSLTGQQRVGLVGLLAHAHAQQVADPGFLAEWSRHAAHDRTAERAGHTVSVPTPPVLDTADTGPSLVAVVGSVHDTTRSRLQAGQACQRVALTAAAEGQSAVSLASVVQVPITRTHLRTLVRGGIWPQAALYFGFASGQHAHHWHRATPIGG